MMNRQKLCEIYLRMAVCVGMMLGMASCGSDSFDDAIDIPTLTTTPTPAVTPTPAAIPTAAANANLVMNDPLTTGTSNYGAAHGGTFSAAGFRVNSSQGEYLAYSTSIQGNIRVEFDAIGYQLGADKSIFLEIFDTSHNTSWVGGTSAWATNSLFQILLSGPSVRIKVGGYNNWRAEWMGPYAWDSATNYHWVFSITNGRCEVTRNGQTMASGAIGGYNPRAPLNIRIGGTWDPVWTGVAGITYSNVKVYKQ